jgi:hypothetical protein
VSDICCFVACLTFSAFLHLGSTGQAYSEKVELTDGRELEFTKRERPHLVFDKDGVTPVALTNGAGIDGIGQYDDAVWTFLQPLATPDSNSNSG